MTMLFFVDSLHCQHLTQLQKLVCISLAGKKEECIWHWPTSSNFYHLLYLNCLNKARLDVALGSLVWRLATLQVAWGLKLDDL